MRSSSRLALALSVAAAAALHALSAMAAASSFTLSSSDFPRNGQIPEKFVFNMDGCAGENISPELHWSGAPPGTKSFAITLFDGYGPPSGWWHWIIYNIPGTRSDLPRGAGSEHSAVLPAGALGGRNDYGNAFYDGPCPDPGDPPHRYLFTIYALKTDQLPVKAAPSGAMMAWKVEEFTLAKATLVAHHRHIRGP